jgi:hypothetical protein
MSNLSINNFVRVSVSTPPPGLAEYQVNNLALFTKESPINTDITATNPGIYLSPSDVAADWGSASEVYQQANAIFGQNPCILDGGGSLIIFPMASDALLQDAITAAIPVTSFFGAIPAGYDPSDDEYIAAAAVCEPARIKLFASTYLTSALDDTTGLFAILSGSDVPHTRMLLYVVGASLLNARLMAAAYAGRAMSVDFAGDATTSTMQLKDLVGVLRDTGITQTILDRCNVLGVDTYGAYASLGAVQSTGAAEFWDYVYGLDWLVFALQVAGFNALRTTGTKIPQTEAGMATLRAAYIAVLKQAVNNGLVAPGTWTSAEKFGNPDTMLKNIEAQGWYIYNIPIGQQLPADRAARKAPPIRIAVKMAGAIHTSEVIVSVSA